MLLVFQLEHHPPTASLAEVPGVLKGRMTSQVPYAPAGSIDVSQMHGRHRTTGKPAFQVAVDGPMGNDGIDSGFQQYALNDSPGTGSATLLTRQPQMEYS